MQGDDPAGLEFKDALISQATPAGVTRAAMKAIVDTCALHDRGIGHVVSLSTPRVFVTVLETVTGAPLTKPIVVITVPREYDGVHGLSATLQKLPWLNTFSRCAPARIQRMLEDAAWAGYSPHQAAQTPDEDSLAAACARERHFVDKTFPVNDAALAASRLDVMTAALLTELLDWCMTPLQLREGSSTQCAYVKARIELFMSAEKEALGHIPRTLQCLHSMAKCLLEEDSSSW